ncbi:MAG: hypothetical protein LBQ48_07145 [Oscillospiraceae bacterium]|jgi:hypothetical protein|nr:hypothetical protein [Oscillospiraceae bacterium]
MAINSGVELHDFDVQDFIKTLDSCKGNVYLESDEGDCLNLRSKLAQLVGLTSLIQGGIISRARIRCELPEDETLLFRFGLYREIPEAK